MPRDFTVGLTGKISPTVDSSAARRAKQDLNEELSEVEELQPKMSDLTMRSGVTGQRAAAATGQGGPGAAGGGGGMMGGAFGEMAGGVMGDMLTGDAGGGLLGGGGRRGGGGRKGGPSAGSILSGLTTSSGLMSVALGGIVGAGLLAGIGKLASASPALGQTLSVLKEAMTLFFRPFGNLLAKALMPFAKPALKAMAKFNKIYSENGLSVALGFIGKKAITAFAGGVANAVKDVFTGDATMSDWITIGGTGLAIAKLLSGGSLLSLLGGPTSLLSLLGGPTSLTSLLGGTTSLTTLLGGSTSLTTLLGGTTSLGAIVSGVSLGALVFGVSAAAVLGAVKLTTLVTPVSMDEIINNPDEQVGMGAEDQEDAGDRGARGAGVGGPPDDKVGAETTDPGGDPSNSLGDDEKGVDPRNVPSRGNRRGFDSARASSSRLHLNEGGLVPEGEVVPATLHGPEAVIPLEQAFGGATGTPETSTPDQGQTGTPPTRRMERLLERIRDAVEGDAGGAGGGGGGETVEVVLQVGQRELARTMVDVSDKFNAARDVRR